MTHAHGPKPHHPIRDVPDESEPGAPPVEPDAGPVLTIIPGDLEHESGRLPTTAWTVYGVQCAFAGMGVA